MNAMDGFSLMSWEHGQTAYKVVGDLNFNMTPLVIVHGGPGSTHDSLTCVADFVNAIGRPAILYDQLGCGYSTRQLEKSPDFWTINLFKNELTLLLQHLNIEENFILLGQSWGGLLVAEYAIDQPPGLKALILSSALNDSDLWVKESRILANQMPAEIAAMLIKHEDAGTTDHPDYAAAIVLFYAQHICTIPVPQEFKEKMERIGKSKHVYNAMWGPSELICSGTLAHHVISDRLHRINVPTLAISGSFDLSTPKVNQVFLANIPEIHWELYEESSHVPYLEEPAKYQRILNEFLSGF